MTMEVSGTWRADDNSSMTMTTMKVVSTNANSIRMNASPGKILPTEATATSVPGSPPKVFKRNADELG